MTSNLSVYEIINSARIESHDYFYLKLIKDVPDVLQAHSLLYNQLHKDFNTSFTCGLENVFDNGRFQFFAPYNLDDPDKYFAPKWALGPTGIELVVA